MAKRGFLARLCVSFVLLCAAVFAAAQSGPTVATDKSDYAPGETVQISGSGWYPNQTVTLQVAHTTGAIEGGEGHEPFNVTSDDNGNISATWFVDADDSLGSSFLVTADCHPDGMDAQHADCLFTDKDKSTTTTVSSQNPSNYTGSVTFTFTVTSTAAPAPTGTVDVSVDGTTVATVALTNVNSTTAHATYSTSALTGGNHTIKGDYNGDGNYNKSNDSLTQTVNKANSSTAIVSSLNPSFQGQSVTFTATVSGIAGGATPTGNVTFKDGATSLGTTVVSGGVATFSTTTLTVASHSITALYNADINYNSSTSGTVVQVVNGKVNTTATLGSSQNPSQESSSVTFTATVSPVSGVVTPTGTVTFKDGAATIGTGTLNGSGVAILSISSLTAGTHSITAAYAGDAGNNSSTSSAVSQKVIGSTTTTVVSNHNPSVFNQSVTFTATVSVSAGTPTGTVTFMDGASTLGTGTLSGTNATFSTSSLAIGTHGITAVYGGDANYNGSTSPNLNQVVNQGATTTSVVSSLNPSLQGQNVTFTATVSAAAPSSGTPTGIVTFKDGASTLGTGTLSGNTATFSTNALTIGTHTITASYGGDANYASSNSGNLSQVVRDPATTLTVGSSANPSTFGQSVTFTSKLTNVNGNFSGQTITFTDGPTVIGTANTNGGGNASVAISTLSLGSHTITATFAGANGFSPSSNSLTQVVNKATATVTITNTTQTYNGSPRPVTVTTTPAGLTVDVTYDGSQTAPTNAGTYAVVATVNDPSYQGSNTATLTVNKATATLSLTGLSATYDGNPHAASVTTTPSGLTVVNVTYNGSSTSPTNAGTYPVIASLTNANYTATNATGNLVIAKANATVNVIGGTFIYDGNPHPATVSVTGVNNEDLGSASVTYTPGGSNAPVNAGSYSVQASFAGNTNYNSANGSDSVTINKADQTIIFDVLSDKHFGDVDVTLSATASSGLTVSFNVSAPATLVGNTMSFPANGGATVTITVTASQAGDANHNAATDVIHTFQLLENVKPTSTADAQPAANAAGWNRTPVTVTITSTDNAGGDSVKEIHYSVNGGSETVVAGDTATVSLSTDGTFAISYHAVDNAGNIESSNSTTVKLDQIAPTLNADADRDPDSNGWYTAPIDVTFAADDGSGSGVDNTTLTAPIHYDGPDSKLAFVEGDASDMAGNSSHKVFHFKYDATKPDILVAGLNGHAFESVSFDISASDHSSGADIHLQATLKKEGVTVWTYDGTAVLPSAPTQSLSGAANDGHYSLEVTATDEAGHVATYSKNFKIDNQAPVITFDPATPQDGGFYNSSQTITYSITDQDTPLTIVQTLLSMIASVDIGPNPLTSGTVVSQEGRYVVHLEATDCLGHTSDVTRTFTVDLTKPVVDDAVLSGTAAPNAPWFESDVNVTLTSSDPDIRENPTQIEGSGVKEMRYYATGAQPIGDSGNPTVAGGATAMFTINTEGVTTITYWSVDNAGNESEHKTVTVKYDKMAPQFDEIDNITTTADKAEGKDVVFTLPTPTDNVDASPSIVASPASGSTFGVGETTVTVTATDAAGQTFQRTFKITVNNPVPVLTSIDPDTKTYLDAGFTMTIHGDKFMPNSVVRMDGSDRPTTFVSFTELTTEIPASDMNAAGTKTVTVFTPTPGGGTSNGVTFTIQKKHQTITFNAIVDHAYGDAPFNVNPTSDSGLTVTLSIVSGPASGSGNQITITGAGTVKVRASQAGNENYFAADDVDQSFDVAKATPQITVTGGTFTYDGDPHPATGTLTGVNGDNLGDPTITYTPGGSNAPVHAGTYQVKASFAGNDNYNAVSKCTTIVINKAHATLALSNLHYTYDGNGHSATVTTTPSGLSGVTVTYNGSQTTPTNAGSYAVVAHLDHQDYEADDANDTLVIDKADATVHIAGGTFTYDGNPHAATATVTGVNNEDLGAVNITYTPGGNTVPVNAGSYSAKGDFAGNQNYNPAMATVSLTINKAHATITLSDLHYTYNGSGRSATATTNPTGLSGVTVTYDGGSALPVHAGSYAVQATLDNPNYEAEAANDTLVIDKANPTVKVDDVHVTYDGDPHPATGSAKGVNSEDLGSLTFAYTPGGSTVPVHAGTYSVIGSFAGNGDYNSGNANATVQIDKADQTINFGALPNKTYGNPAIILSATATSGLPVSFSLVSGPATLVGNTLTITGAGTIKVRATQAGSADYNAAPNVDQSFDVAKATPTVTVTGGTFTYDGNGHSASVTITGVNGDVLPVPSITYTPNVASPKDAGTYLASATFAGNANYNSANGSANVVINKATLVVTADDKSKALNAPNPALTGAITGAVGTDGISASYATTATTTSDVGTYPITPALNDPNNRLGNYNVTKNNGTLTIGYKNNSGVLQPLNQDGSSVNKQGSTIPVKFQVFDANNVSIGAPGTVVSFSLIQIINGTTSTTVNETPVATNNDTAFRYDGQWIFNLSTKNLSAGKTYVYRITLKDGSFITFQFGLR